MMNELLNTSKVSVIITGLLPLSYSVDGSCIRISFNVPCPPLCFDTVHVSKADNYGFDVIRKDNADIISDVRIDSTSVIITCTESPENCMRYGINSEYLKGGREKGSRGDLRDSQSSSFNWCLLFESVINEFSCKT